MAGCAPTYLFHCLSICPTVYLPVSLSRCRRLLAMSTVVQTDNDVIAYLTSIRCRKRGLEATWEAVDKEGVVLLSVQPREAVEISEDLAGEDVPG